MQLHDQQVYFKEWVKKPNRPEWVVFLSSLDRDEKAMLSRVVGATARMGVVEDHRKRTTTHREVTLEEIKQYSPEELKQRIGQSCAELLLEMVTPLPPVEEPIPEPQRSKRWSLSKVLQSLPLAGLMRSS